MLRGCLYMKMKSAPIIMSIILLALLTGCTNNINSLNAEHTMCGVDNCNNLVIKNDYGHGVYSYGKYCDEHTCKEDGCGGMIQNNGDYCNIHTEKQIALSDEQLIEVRQVADEYIAQLMSMHSNILAVNIINDSPKLTTTDIQYRCNVVREDNATNLAAMYIWMSDDGTFTVKELEYDETYLK